MTTDISKIDEQALRKIYGNLLYSIDQQAERPVKENSKVAHKKVLVITRELIRPGDKLFTFLEGILGACKLQMNSVNLLVSFDKKEDYQGLRSTYGATNVLLFGVETADIGLPVFFPHFQIQAHDGVSYISSPDLSVIENDKMSKQKLWQSLKKAFSL